MALRQPIAVYRALTSSVPQGSQSTFQLLAQLHLKASTDSHVIEDGTEAAAPKTRFSFSDHAALWTQPSRAAFPCNSNSRHQMRATSLLSTFYHPGTPSATAQQVFVHLISTSDGRRTTQGTGSAGQDKDKASRKPDAGACDEALTGYQALKSRFDKLQKPSTLKPWHEVVVDFVKMVGGATVAIVRYTIAIPQKIQEFREMPKEDWQKWKAKAWETTKHEAHHYWVGTKLLWFEIKISSRLAIKAARGKELSRRERQQLARTTADLVRLVPMVVILVIPFLEFSLPFLLRIFPNMLPSTYEDKLKKEEELKRRLAVKLELARFLQDTVAEVAKDISRRKGSGSAKELYEFIKKVRSGEPVENTDLLRFAQLFNDELTLDNLERVQLVSMCQFVGIAPFGTDSFLRSRLRAQLQQIKQDDYAIENEGLENLTEEELRAACRARGMRAPFGEGAVVFMRRQLQDWLDLSLHRGLPSSLLLLSRAFTITASVRDVAKKKELAYEKVKETLSVIPEEVLDKVSYEALGGEQGTASALEKKLELLKREETLIKQELARAAVAQEKQAAGAAPGTAPAKAEARKEPSLPQTLASAVASTGKVTDGLSSESISEEEKALASDELRQRRLHKTLQALMDLAANSGVAKERVLFLELIKTETERLNSDLARSAKGQGGGNLVFSNRGMQVGSADEGAAQGAGDGSAEDGAPSRLANRVSKMLASIEKELDTAEVSIGGRMHLLDKDNDGVISQEELQNAVQFLKEQLSAEELQQLFDRLKDAEAQSSSAPGSFSLSRLLQVAASDQKVEAEAAGTAAGPEVVQIHIK